MSLPAASPWLEEFRSTLLNFTLRTFAACETFQRAKAEGVQFVQAHGHGLGAVPPADMPPGRWNELSRELVLHQQYIGGPFAISLERP